MVPLVNALATPWWTYIPWVPAGVSCATPGENQGMAVWAEVRVAWGGHGESAFSRMRMFPETQLSSSTEDMSNVANGPPNHIKSQAFQNPGIPDTPGETPGEILGRQHTMGFTRGILWYPW